MFKNNGKTGWARKWIIAAVVLAIVAGSLLLLPLTPLKSKAKARLTGLIVAQLGPGASIGNIDFGWRNVVVRDVMVPLDSKGSQLRIRQIEAAIDPLRLVRSPEQATRIVQRARLSDVEVHVSSGGAQPRGADQSWLPPIRIPASVYTAVSRFDSLYQLEIRNARVTIGRAAGTPLELCRLNADVWSEGNERRLHGKGFYLADSARTLTLTGSLAAALQKLDLQAILDWPAGPVPELPDGISVSSRGGHMALRLSTEDSSATVRASAVLSGVEGLTPAGPLQAEALRVSLSGDTVTLDSASIAVTGGKLAVGGMAVLRGPGTLRLSGDVSIQDIAAWHDQRPELKPLTGSLHAAVVVSGSLSAPELAFELAAQPLAVSGYDLTELSAKGSLSRNLLELSDIVAASADGRGGMRGTVILGREPRLDLQGSVMLQSAFRISAWESDLRQVDIRASGPLETPQVQLQLLGDAGRSLSSGQLTRFGNEWQLSLAAPGLGSTTVQLSVEPDLQSVSVRNAHVLLSSLFSSWQPSLKPIQAFDASYTGNSSAGTLELQGTLAGDSVSIWARLAREFHFTGQYQHSAKGDLTVSGAWRGTAGDGDPFEGHAQVALVDSVLTIDHFFIDIYGDVKGSVDLRRRELDVELSFADLSARKLPLPPEVLQRYGVHGALSGFARVYGSLTEPLWQGNVAMVEGAVFGVPGYWLNLEVTGEGAIGRIRTFEMGRDIRRILAASGDVDFRNRNLGITAELGAARAEDFFQALTGWRNVLSGDLDGRAAISGRFTDWDAEAELRVLNGKLLGEIAADEFVLTFRTDRTAHGQRVLRVPKLEFQRSDKYRFQASAEMTPGNGGALSASIEGSGDFLDVLDQLDGTFRSEGSDCHLVMNFGGTLNRPQFLGGEFTLARGRFVYTPANPGPINTEMAFRVAGSGDVEAGKILLRSGDEWMRISVLANCDSAAPGLEPLIIPTPRLCLGVLQLESGDEGMTVRLPGFMRDEWTGVVTAGAQAGDPIRISAHGPDRLRISGNAQLSNARMTFPFVATGSGGRVPPVTRWLVRRLEQAVWDLDVTVGSGNHYLAEVTGLKNSTMFATLRNSPIFSTLADYLDHLSIDAVVEPTETPLEVRGVIDSSTFYLNGHLSTTRGQVDYLDQSFRIDYAYADFDGTHVMPILEGRASTTGVDSLGRPVYLTMYQIDRETGIRQRRGRLDQLTFVLEAEGVEAPEYALQVLGYDLTEAGGNAERVVASSFARAIGRQWIDPLERRLERWTLLDEIALTPGSGRGSSLARQQRLAAQQQQLPVADADQPYAPPGSAVRFLTGSQVTVGKYLTRDLFLTYTGELSEGQIELRDRLGLIHSWNVQYRIFPLSRDLVLDFAVEYDEIIRQRDESVSLKYSFSLEP